MSKPNVSRKQRNLLANFQALLVRVPSLVAVSLFVFLATNAYGVGTYQHEAALKKTESAEKEFERQSRKIGTQLEKFMKSEMRRARTAGQSAYLRSLEDALSDFTRVGTLPTVIETIPYRAQMQLAFEETLAEFETEISNLIKAGDDKAAEEIEYRRDDFDDRFDRNHPSVRLLRTRWEHEIGSFTKTGQRAWVERTPNSRHSFVEVSRNPACVELYDQSRECYVSLNYSECWVRFGKKKQKRFYFGRWAD